MHYLWQLKKAYLKDIVKAYPTPSPAYTTVSTVVNVLVKKGFIGFETHGKAREYYAQISQSQYRKYAFKSMLNSFFNDSPAQFASFFTKENDLDMQELEELKKMIEDKIANQQKDQQ